MTADVVALRHHLASLGLQHAVLVQPSPYGTDHACLLDALASFGGSAIGVFAFDVDHRYDDTFIDTLRHNGVRGLRIHAAWLPDSQASRVLRRAASTLADTGLHIELQVRATQLTRLLCDIESFDLPVVFDHYAGLDGIDDLPPILAERLARGTAWIKLSAPYRLDDPRNALRTATALATRYPSQCLFGSDWPHTNQVNNTARRHEPVAFRDVNDASAAAELAAALPGSLGTAVFAGNPSRLYGARTVYPDPSRRV